MNEIKAKTLSSLFWRFIERVGGSFVSLLVQIVLARLLSPDDFGSLAMIIVFINVANVFVVSGLNTALIQAKDVELADYSTVFWMSLLVALIFMSVVWMTAPMIAGFCADEHLTSPLRILTVLLPLAALCSVQKSKVTRDLEMKKTSIATLFASAISGVLGIIAALSGFGLWALVIQQISYQVVCCLVLLCIVPWRPHFVFRRKRAAAFLRFSWKILMAQLIGMGYQSASTFIIGREFSQETLGYVSQGEKYPKTLGSILSGTIQSVMLSVYSKFQDDRDALKSVVRRSIKISAYVVFPCMALFGVLASPLISVLLGDNWLPAVPFMQMYCAVMSFGLINAANCQVFDSVGRSDLSLKLEFLKSTLGMVMLLVGVFIFRNVYVVVALIVVVSILSLVINTFPNKFLIGYSLWEQIKDILPVMLLTLVSMAITLCLSLCLRGIVLIVVSIMAFFGAYLGASILLSLEQFEYLKCTLVESFARRKAG